MTSYAGGSDFVIVCRFNGSSVRDENCSRFRRCVDKGRILVTGPAGEGTLTPFSFDPANVELVATFLKNYNTMTVSLLSEQTLGYKAGRFYSVSICGALSVLRRLSTFSPFLRPSPICLAKFDRCFA